MTKKQENEIYHMMNLSQVKSGLDYFIDHEDEDSLREIGEYFCKKVGDKGYDEIIIYLFDFSSRFLTDRKKWLLKINRRMTEMRKDKDENDKHSPENRQLSSSLGDKQLLSLKKGKGK